MDRGRAGVTIIRRTNFVQRRTPMESLLLDRYVSLGEGGRGGRKGTARIAATPYVHVCTPCPRACVQAGKLCV